MIYMSKLRDEITINDRIAVTCYLVLSTPNDWENKEPSEANYGGKLSHASQRILSIDDMDEGRNVTINRNLQRLLNIRKCTRLKQEQITKCVQWLGEHWRS